MKKCTKCKEEKPDNQFWPDNRNGKLLPRCKSCKATYAKIWRQKNPHKQLERYWSNPAGERERHLIRKYGVTLAAYEAMFKVQGGKCAICGKIQTKAFDVDHCHNSGAVRGLLCTNCNRMIGHAHDDAARLVKAANYLSSRKSRRNSSKHIARP